MQIYSYFFCLKIPQNTVCIIDCINVDCYVIGLRVSIFLLLSLIVRRKTFLQKKKTKIRIPFFARSIAIYSVRLVFRNRQEKQDDENRDTVPLTEGTVQSHE